MAVRILIADDHENVRAAVAQLIQSSGQDWEICGGAFDGKDAVAKAAALKPDVVVLDLVMPNLDGMNAGREIRSLLPNVPMVMYSLLASAYLEGEAKKAGFQAVVQKSNGAALIEAIRDALAARGLGDGHPPPPAAFRAGIP